MGHSETSRIVIKVSIITIIVNLLLVIAKSILGVVFNNLSILSDAIHSASDLLTSFIIIATVFLSSPKRDKKYNYGREKIEPLVVLFLALIICGVGVFLAYEGITNLFSPKDAELNWYLIGVVIFSIIVKEFMFYYEIYYAKKINSAMLRADAWHSRSDSLSSVAVLIGLVTSIFTKTNIAESIAVIIVSAFIIKVSFDIAKVSVSQLIDKSADENVCNKIREIALAIEGINSVDKLRTRLFGNCIFVDIEIAIDGNLNVFKSHDIAHILHDTLENNEELRIKHCHVHINPASN